MLYYFIFLIFLIDFKIQNLDRLDQQLLIAASANGLVFCCLTLLLQ